MGVFLRVAVVKAEWQERTWLGMALFLLVAVFLCWALDEIQHRQIIICTTRRTSNYLEQLTKHTHTKDTQIYCNDNHTETNM